jgi:glutathione S-transferase
MPRRIASPDDDCVEASHRHEKCKREIAGGELGAALPLGPGRGGSRAAPHMAAARKVVPDAACVRGERSRPTAGRTVVRPRIVRAWCVSARAALSPGGGGRDVAAGQDSHQVQPGPRETSIMLALYHNDMSLCAQKVRVCLAEKKLPWEDRHIVLRSGEHQKPWYVKLNRRAVVPTLLDGDKVITESNVILEYLDEAHQEPPLAPQDPYGRAKMRVWTKQLDEDVHDASAAILSFGIAFRHQYLERGELGKRMLEQIPNLFKRERRRDVIEKGPGSQHFVIAVRRMVQLLDEMEEALREHAWLAGDMYTLADVAFTPYLARLEHLNILDMVGDRSRVADWYARCKVRPSFAEAIRKWENPDYLGLMQQRGREAWPKVREIMRAA